MSALLHYYYRKNMEVPQNVQTLAKVPQVKEAGKHCPIVHYLTLNIGSQTFYFTANFENFSSSTSTFFKYKLRQ